MREGVQIGQLFWTPAMIADYMRQTDEHFTALNRDAVKARGQGRINDPTWKNYVGFIKGWRRYYQENADSWSGGTVDRAKQWRLQLQEWRNRIGRLPGVKLASQKLPDKRTEPFWSGAGIGFGSGALVVMGLLLMWALRAKA